MLRGVLSSWETSLRRRLRRSRCVCRAVVILLKALLICPSSSEEVTGNKAVSPRCATVRKAWVRVVTGVEMRLESQAASRRAMATVSSPPVTVV